MMEAWRKQWGTPPWHRANFRFEPGARTATAVAIVGGGLTGASTAYHLARRGIACTVFEAGSIGDGASGRTGGLVLEGTAAGPLETRCIAELQKLVAAEAIDCDLNVAGCWEIEHRVDSAGVRLPWDDEGYPVSIARTVAGGTVEPARLLTGIAGAAARLGASILSNTPVQRITMAPRLALEAANRTIHPDYIVLATNAWLPVLLPDLDWLRSCLTFACATDPLSDATIEAIGLRSGTPFYTVDLPYLWGRITNNGLAIFGAGLVFDAPEQLERHDVSAANSHSALVQLQSRVRALNPELRNVRFSAAWAGPIAFARDAVPILSRHPSSPKVIVAGGYAGHGVAFSVRAGQLIAAAIADGAALPDWGALDRRTANAADF